MMLLQSLLKTKTLQATDTYVIMVDLKTWEVLQTIGLFKQPNIDLIIMPTPETILEGMTWRYRLHRQMDILDKAVCYMDVDMLCVRNMKIELPDVANALLVFPEGKPDDSNYMTFQTPLKTAFGVSSGFFVYKCGPKVLQFLEEVYYNIRTGLVPYYTIDQPHFNKALEDKDFFHYMNPKAVSYNGHNIDPSDPPVFINCCGDPGSGHFHLVKMLQFFIGMG